MTATERRAAAVSHVGNVRGNNEDAHATGAAFWLVADGLGGHAGGEVASRLAVEAARAVLDEAGAEPAATLRAAFEAAQTAIVRVAWSRPDLADMGTTLVAGLVDPQGTLFVGNLGDSRAYLLADGELHRLTTDDNAAEELVAEGLLTPDQARFHPGRFVLSKALGLGTGAAPTPAVTAVRDAQGRLLLCSDGLNSELADEEIRSALGGGTPADACQRLVEGALAAGGRDNVTVVVVDL